MPIMMSSTLTYIMNVVIVIMMNIVIHLHHAVAAKSRDWEADAVFIDDAGGFGYRRWADDCVAAQSSIVVLGDLSQWLARRFRRSRSTCIIFSRRAIAVLFNCRNSIDAWSGMRP